MNLCGVRLVRRQDVPVSLSFLGRELEAGRVTLAAYHKRNGQLLAYHEGQITGGAVEMVVDFDTQEIRVAAREAEGKTIEARVAVLVETEEGKGVYHSLPLNFYLEPGLIGDEHLPNSARPEWEMMYETVLERAEETEGYAGSALASKRAAAASEAAAGTSATNAARDAKSAHDAKTAVESLATTWPETVSNGKQQIIEAKNEAVTAIQDKQANSVLAVGRAQKTATDKISGAQADAVSAVQAAGKEAQGTITPLVQRVETAKEAIDQAEGRINTAATNAANSATSAGNSATAAANALAAIPQVDAEGNMTLAGNITVMSASINGPFVAGRPDGTVSAGTCNQIYGFTRFWQSLDVRDGGWWRGTMMYESGMLNIAQRASLNCIGPAAFASTLNANGGVNIPLAVGAPTDTSAVNRLYAAGLAAVTEAFSSQSFLSGYDSYGAASSVEQIVPGWCWRLKQTAAGASTVKVSFQSPFLGISNYSGWNGFVLPLAAGNTGSTVARKVSFSIGKRGSVVEKTAESLDMFTLSPASGSTASFPRFVDVTFYLQSDASASPAGYPVRVRELMYDSSAGKWVVHETQSVIPSFNTNPSATMFLACVQNRVSSTGAAAGLWIGSNAYDTRRLLCIADLHPLQDSFDFSGVDRVYWDSEGINSFSLIGAMRQLTAPGSNQPNGAYDAFRALETRLIQSTTVTEFTPYE
ncbi:MAG: hypothetical protein K1W11_01490 [Akkermansia muciniphila]